MKAISMLLHTTTALVNHAYAKSAHHPARPSCCAMHTIGSRMGRLLLSTLFFCALAQAQSTLATPGRSNPSISCDQIPATAEPPNHCSPTSSMPSSSSEPRLDGYGLVETVDRPAAPVRRPPLKKTEFEVFAEDATGMPGCLHSRLAEHHGQCPLCLRRSLGNRQHAPYPVNT